MDDLSDEAVEEYLATGEWQGKAGAFGYQDRLGWVHVVSGSESNVVGLPMEMLSGNAGRSRGNNRQRKPGSSSEAIRAVV